MSVIVNFPTIDQVLSDDVDYSITFTRNITPPCCDEDTSSNDEDTSITEVFTGRGTKGVLEALAQVLVIMDDNKDEFPIPDLKLAQAEERCLIDQLANMPQEIKEIQASLAELAAHVVENFGEGEEPRRYINTREFQMANEARLWTMLESKEDLILRAKRRARTAYALSLAIKATREDRLDTDTILFQDALFYGFVPYREPRCTIGALIYYYVDQLANNTPTSRLTIESIDTP